MKLEALVDFLNQRYDKNGIPVCDEKNFAADFFLYRPYLDEHALMHGGISKTELFSFYRETRKVRKKILGKMLALISGRPSRSAKARNQLRLKMFDEVGTSGGSVYRLIDDVFDEGFIDCLGCCEWSDCEIFFVKEDLRKRYCSDDCYDEHDRHGSAKRQRDRRRKLKGD